MDNTKELIKYAKHQKILLVEDDKVLNDNLYNTLTNLYGIVEKAYDGEEALEIFKQNRFDLIITDIKMPKMDGITLTKEIKKIHYDKAIIIMSAHNENSFLIDLINEGVDGFLLKPLIYTNLLNTLHKISKNIFYKKEYEKIRIKKLIAIFLESKDARKPNNTETFEFTKQIKESTQNQDKHDKNSSAINYLKNLSQGNDLFLEIQYAIDDLTDLNDDFENEIETMNLGNNVEVCLINIVDILNKYYTTLSNINGFAEVAQTINNFATELKELNYQDLNDQQKESVLMLEFVKNDIKTFIDKTLVNKSVDGIDYFKDSLSNSVNDLLVQIGIREEKVGDIDFF